MTRFHQSKVTSDIIYVDWLCEKVDELEPEVDSNGHGEHIAEWKAITAILAKLKGAGGDHEWRGDWYPSELIHEYFFEQYVRDMLEECGTIPKDLPHWVHIDWERTAKEVQVDYTSIDIKGSTYWFR